MAVAASDRRPTGEELDVKKVQDELEELGEETAVGDFPLHAQTCPGELSFELGEGITFPFVAEVFQPEPQGGPELVQNEETAGMGGNGDEFAAGLEDTGDFRERPVIVLYVLEIVETEDEVEQALPVRQVFSFELDEVAFEYIFGCQKIGHVFIGMDPESAPPPGKIAQDALRAAQVQRYAVRGDGNGFPQKPQLVFFLEGFFDQPKLPGFLAHRQDYRKTRGKKQGTAERPAAIDNRPQVGVILPRQQIAESARG